MKELIEIQEKLKAPKGQYNSFGKYNYRSAEDILDALKPLLKATKSYVTLSDDIVAVGNRIYVKSTVKLTNSEHESEQVTAFAREAEVKKGMDDSQITGTASSYARKYALNGLFAIDDTKDADSYDNRSYQQTVKAGNKQTIDEPTQRAINIKASSIAKKLGKSEQEIVQQVANMAKVDSIEAIPLKWKNDLLDYLKTWEEGIQ